MSDQLNPAWELYRQLEGDDGTWRGLAPYLSAWIQDVERRLPALPPRPAPRAEPGAAMAAAVERNEQAATKPCKCGGTYQPRGAGMACDKCERYHRTEGRPQSSWIVSEEPAGEPDKRSELIQLRERVHYLDALAEAQEAALRVAKATIEARDAEMASLRESLQVSQAQEAATASLLGVAYEEVSARDREVKRLRGAIDLSERDPSVGEGQSPGDQAPGPIEALRKLLAEVCASPILERQLKYRGNMLVQALRDCYPHQIMVFRPSEVLP